MVKKTLKTRTFEGLPVVDATHDIALHVLSIDVKNATKNDPKSCAAAKAGQRELKKDVRVFLTRTYVKEKKNWVRYLTPESVSREIISFDRGSSFEPGIYNVKAPHESMKLGHYRGRSFKPKTGKTNQKPRHATGMIRHRANYDENKK